MSERFRAKNLLARAREAYDADGSPLPALARRVRAGGFDGGARWMAAAMAQLRGNGDPENVPLPQVSFARLGTIKYALATSAALLVVAAAVALRLPLLALLAVPAFYAVEVQMVFLFPAAIDGSARPFRDSRRLIGRAGGTMGAMPVVMRLAAHMLFGGLLGHGLIRAWCCGCLAVCVWYEALKHNDAPSSRPAKRGPFARGALTMREEEVRTSTGEAGRPPREAKLLYASDLHLGRPWTRRVPDDLARIARNLSPDAIILGGDLVDTPGGTTPLTALVRSLAALAPMFAVAGNHDRRAGVDAIRTAVVGAGGQWLEDACATLPGGIQLVGPACVHRVAGAGARVLCAHDPAVFARPDCEGFDLVLAGHLHGGQCVLATGRGPECRLYPGAWFNRWTGLRFVRGRSTMLVSRGVADTLPLRWNCPREVLLCRILY